MEYKVERTVVRCEKHGKQVSQERFTIYRKCWFMWSKIEQKPSFSLAKQLLKNIGITEFIFVEKG